MKNGEVLPELKIAYETYFELDSKYGHNAAALDAAKWAPTLKAFMDRASAT